MSDILPSTELFVARACKLSKNGVDIVEFKVDRGDADGTAKTSSRASGIDAANGDSAVKPRLGLGLASRDAKMQLPLLFLVYSLHDWYLCV